MLLKTSSLAKSTLQMPFLTYASNKPQLTIHYLKFTNTSRESLVHSTVIIITLQLKSQKMESVQLNTKPNQKSTARIEFH